MKMLTAAACGLLALSLTSGVGAAVTVLGGGQAAACFEAAKAPWSVRR